MKSNEPFGEDSKNLSRNDSNQDIFDQIGEIEEEEKAINE